jgi:predicted nucleotidyltransferase
MKNADQHLEKLRQLILNYVANYRIKVYLRGSRAKGTAHNASDIDISFLPLEPLPDDFFKKLHDLLKKNSPYEIDLIDLSKEHPKDCERLLRGAIVWKE